MIKEDHVNVLIFWSVNCQHCRRELPLINAWLKQNQDGLNVISAAGVPDAVTKTRTDEESLALSRTFFKLCRENDARLALTEAAAVSHAQAEPHPSDTNRSGSPSQSFANSNMAAPSRPIVYCNPHGYPKGCAASGMAGGLPPLTAAA